MRTSGPRRAPRALAYLCLLALLPSVSAGCARARAKTAPDAPPLDVPLPPPRDVEPLGGGAPESPVPLQQEPARNPAAQHPPAPREAPKPEPAKPEPPPPAEPEKPAESQPAKPSTLQTTPAAAEGEVERGIRATLVRAAADLNRIDYRALNADARAQYDIAKSFIRQADEAIRAKNLVFARNLADKAEALATQLAGK